MKSTWSKKSIGELCADGGGKVQTGPFGSQLHQSDYSEDGIPVVMPADIPSGRIDVRRIARVSEGHVQRLSRHKFKKGDIVYGRRGDIGRQALISVLNEGWLCGTGCLRIRLGYPEVDPEYLHRYLTMPEIVGWIEGQAIGATMPNLNTDILNRVPVYFPKLETQRKIAAILTTYDDLIETNKCRIALLEKMAEELYREWFVRMRFPGHQSTRFIKGVPEEWSYTPINEVFDYLEGPGIRNWQYQDSGFPFINIRLIQDGDIDQSKASCINENEALGKYVHFHLQEGDFVVSTSGTLGRGAVVQSHHLPLMLNTSVIRFREKVPHSKAFMYGYLKSELFVKQIETFATGSAQKNFGPMHLALMKIAKPNCEILQKFNEICYPIYQNLSSLRKANRNLQQTRDLLLPRLISGKLSVEDLDIQFPPSMQEVASH